MGNAQSGGDEISTEKIQATFNEFDVNGDGTISSDELQIAIEGISGRKPTDVEIKMLIESVDQNMDGKLQFGEFCDLVRKYVAWTQGGALDAWERLGEELYELALREPLLPGFLHLLGLGAYTADLVDLGYQMATDVAYIKPERITFPMKPVHKRKLLHCAALLRCRKPPHLLSEAELKERSAQKLLLYRSNPFPISSNGFISGNNNGGTDAGLEKKVDQPPVVREPKPQPVDDEPVIEPVDDEAKGDADEDVDTRPQPPDDEQSEEEEDRPSQPSMADLEGMIPSAGREGDDEDIDTRPQPPDDDEGEHSDDGGAPPDLDALVAGASGDDDEDSS